MITDLLFYAFYAVIWLLTAPFRIFDDVVINSSFLGAIDFFESYLSIFSDILPLGTFFAVFSLILTVKNYNVLFKILNWTIKKIPTIS